MSICPTRGGDCDQPFGSCESRCGRASGPRPLDFLMEGVKPCLHFVGFKEHDQRWQNAVRIFGAPDIVHRGWDMRAQREVAWGWDTVVFAKGDKDRPPSRYSFDDSNQDDDPAAAERRA